MIGTPPPPQPEVLRLDAVDKVYPGGVHALRGASLTLCRGDMVAIVGRSGSGKSTLLHIMGTLDRPSRGKVTIAGSDAGSMSDRRLAALRAAHIGFVFQRFFLIDAMTAEENVAQALVYAGVKGRERRRRSLEALDQVGLADRAFQQAGKLSGGEQQRVAIARALVASPSILFADEPTGNLDSTTGAQIVDLLRELAGRGTTLVLITHDPGLAASFPRRIDMVDGRIARDGSNGEVLHVHGR